MAVYLEKVYPMISEKTALEYLNTAREHVKNHDYKGAFLRFIRAGCFLESRVTW